MISQVNWRERVEAIVLRLIVLKAELATNDVCLYRTMHKLDEATREIGWEMADILTGKQMQPWNRHRE